MSAPSHIVEHPILSTTEPVMPSLNATAARWLYFAAQKARGEPVAGVLRELERSQRWGRERLLALQWERQQALVRHAFETTAFYRGRWSAMGLDPGFLREPADWARLPILERRDLQEHSGCMISSRAPGGLIASTSGSSGTPTAVLRSHLSWAHAHANIYRGWHWHGVDVGDRYAYFWGRPLDGSAARKALLRDAFFNRDRCSAFSLDPAHAWAFYHRQLAHPSKFAFGYPSAVAQFASEVESLGLDGRALGWKVVITSAETLRPEQRARILRVFGCPVVDSYGCAEAGVTGFECERGGMHVPVESVVVETVPSVGGLCEVLITDLHNYSQPLIRYRVGDLMEARAIDDDEPCACGRALPVLGRIAGRAGDALELPDGRRLNPNLPSYIFKRYAKKGTVREYQFAQFPCGRIELRVIPGSAWEDSLAPTLRDDVRSALGIEVEVRTVMSLERSERGKHRDFVKVEEAETVGAA